MKLTPWFPAFPTIQERTSGKPVLPLPIREGWYEIKNARNEVFRAYWNGLCFSHDYCVHVFPPYWRGIQK